MVSCITSPLVIHLCFFIYNHYCASAYDLLQTSTAFVCLALCAIGSLPPYLVIGYVWVIQLHVNLTYL